MVQIDNLQRLIPCTSYCPGPGSSSSSIVKAAPSDLSAFPNPGKCESASVCRSAFDCEGNTKQSIVLHKARCGRICNTFARIETNLPRLLRQHHTISLLSQNLAGANSECIESIDTNLFTSKKASLEDFIPAIFAKMSQCISH